MTFYYYSLIVVIPFAIGSAFHYFGNWVGIPALIVGGIFWIAAIANQYKRECEQRANRSSDPTS